MDFNEDPNYLDLEDILTNTQRVGCKFLMDIPGLEFISPGSSQEITESTDLILPFWLAKTFFSYSIVDIELPKQYNSNFRDILSADADVVDLHRFGPHYYKFGKLLVGLRRYKGNGLEQFNAEGQINKFRREEGSTLEDKQAIAKSLMNTFHHRKHKILEFSTNSAADENLREVETFKCRLDNVEKRIFQIGRHQVKEINKWKSREIEFISSNCVRKKMRRFH